MLEFLPVIRACFRRHWGLHFMREVGSMKPFFTSWYDDTNDDVDINTAEENVGRLKEVRMEVDECPLMGAGEADRDGAEKHALAIIPQSPDKEIKMLDEGRGCGHQLCPSCSTVDGHMKNNHFRCLTNEAMLRPSLEFKAVYLSCGNLPI